eukprot:comp22923_c0_seq1/m.36285 comp22923_c0_seq1/g.36285  ORF comp22923_c0_seq1/g.36285 comp22923_c0_seq1/m.36285 type:complete len:324 (-) comp22923_c0_seq1:73-1044(-)
MAGRTLVANLTAACCRHQSAVAAVRGSVSVVARRYAQTAAKSTDGDKPIIDKFPFFLSPFADQMHQEHVHALLQSAGLAGLDYGAVSQALTCNSVRAFASNQTLATLGKSVVQLVLLDALSQAHSSLSIFSTQDLLAHLTAPNMIAAARKGMPFDLATFSNPRQGTERFADYNSCFMALVGVVYTQEGLSAARSFVVGRYQNILSEMDVRRTLQLHRPGLMLRQALAMEGRPAATYSMITEAPLCKVVVSSGGNQLGEGEGPHHGHKVAASAAARRALRTHFEGKLATMPIPDELQVDGNFLWEEEVLIVDRPNQETAAKAEA